MLRSAISIIAALSLQGCTMFGIMTLEEPAYKVQLAQDDFEIREYGEMVLVETSVADDYDDASDEAFQRLFDYIAGANASSTKISMTAPVNMQNTDSKLSDEVPFFREQTENGWKMSFVLPARYSIANAPLPENELVTLRQVPPRRVASKTFSGRWTLDNLEENSDDLMQWVKSQQKEALSPPRVAAYNPPWTIPFLRRNEVHVDIR